MQGINGRQISKEFYDRILELLNAKGNNILSLPKLSNTELKGIILDSEKDVETNYLEVLLRALGFTEKDWETQVKVRVGRKERAIPDYLINVSKNSKEKSVSADWVWEAKYSILTNDQLEKDFGQVCSYAKLVNAKGLGLISKEGIWLSTKKDNFSFKKSLHWSAKRSLESDGLSEIKEIAGKNRMGKL
jgi:hypothetical protein